jgi:hypothetical protein
MNATDMDTSLKAIHAVATAGMGYAKLLEQVELHERLRTVEQKLGQFSQRNGHALQGVS